MGTSSKARAVCAPLLVFYKNTRIFRVFFIKYTYFSRIFHKIRVFFAYTVFYKNTCIFRGPRRRASRASPCPPGPSRRSAPSARSSPPQCPRRARGTLAGAPRVQVPNRTVQIHPRDKKNMRIFRVFFVKYAYFSRIFIKQDSDGAASRRRALYFR